MDPKTQTRTFRGLDGFAGFRHGKTCEVGISKKDDCSGEVLVSMPHALDKGPAKFSAQ